MTYPWPDGPVQPGPWQPKRVAAGLAIAAALTGAASCDTTTYRDCAAVRAAGAAPIHEGDPGYGRHLDRDGDGTGCETDG